MNYYTKASLYGKVHECKNYLGYSETDISIDLISQCNEMGITVCEAAFNTRGLRGMAFIGDNSIVLNSYRDSLEQNFDCCHELMHLYIHNELSRNMFRCFDKMYPLQDKFIEWQANEGTAEFFVPYKVLLPLVKYRYPYLTSADAIKKFKIELADFFNVTTTVIEYRLESLKYEIYQFLNGTSLENVRILSVSQQKKCLIKVKSLNDIEYDMVIKEYKPFQENDHVNFQTLYI